MIKLIHQTSKNSNLTKEQVESKESLIKHNPDFEYRLWTDEDLLKLINEEYPPLLEVWDNILGIQRADLGRYLVLYVYGGFYADTDIFAKSEIKITYPDKIHLSKSTKTLPFTSDTVTNFFMYSPKNNKVFLEIIDESIKRIKDGYKDVPKTTGRILLRDIFKDKEHIIFTDEEVFNKYCYNSEINEKAFAYHDGSTSSGKKGWVNNYKIFFINSECFIKKKLGMNERSMQFPVVTIILIMLIIFFLGYVLTYFF